MEESKPKKSRNKNDDDLFGSFDLGDSKDGK